MSAPEPAASQVQAVFDALASPIRREILWLIWDDERPAGEIAAAFAVTASTISAHLAVLREAGLVTMRVDGTFRRYRARNEALRALRELTGETDGKWVPADDLPETEHASSGRHLVVEASVVVPLERPLAFAELTEGERWSRWMGVPVMLADGHFSCTLEWGTRVRGTYEVVVPPRLIVLQWDFADDTIPVPGRELTAYVELFDEAGGTRVRVHQIVADETEAAFMDVAWSLVLGRLREGAGGAAAARRASRPKKQVPPAGASAPAGDKARPTAR
jgi:DNA-binding transcriptional ArsR family regulator/uncharacterized protein YndB with AHSA1/START domain